MTEAKAKVLVLGENGVGKTCLLLRLTDNKFHTYPVITIGSDYKQTSIEVDGVRVHLEIWDTAGQERYKSLTSRYFRGANAVVLMFDLTDLQSFKAVDRWLNEVSYHGVSCYKCILVGNKTDLDYQRAIETSQAASLADRLGMDYMETSAKDGTNVQQVFLTLTRHMLQQLQTQKAVLAPTETSTSFTLSKNPNDFDVSKRKKRHKCGC